MGNNKTTGSGKTCYCSMESVILNIICIYMYYITQEEELQSVGKTSQESLHVYM